MSDPTLSTTAKGQGGTFKDGLFAAIPIALGYLPIAFSFGVAATRSGLSGAEALSLSLIMYSGAAQFLAVKLIAVGMPFAFAATALVAMALRHLLYGPALIRQAKGGTPGRLAPLWAFGLTDEVFAAALGDIARGRRFSEPFMLGLGLGAYLAWLSGTVFGAYAGGGALQDWPALSAGLGFMLPSLFLALMLSMLTRQHLPVVAVAAVTTVAVTLLWSSTVGLMAGMVAGAASGVLAPVGDRHAR